jgi:hypothetical protein
MEFGSRISKQFGRLFSYAAMKSDEDTRDSEYLAVRQSRYCNFEKNRSNLG